MDILQYVSGKRDKQRNDCANKTIPDDETTQKFVYILDLTSFMIFSEVIP